MNLTVTIDFQTESNVYIMRKLNTLWVMEKNFLFIPVSFKWKIENVYLPVHEKWHRIYWTGETEKNDSHIGLIDLSFPFGNLGPISPSRENFIYSLSICFPILYIIDRELSLEGEIGPIIAIREWSNDTAMHIWHNDERDSSYGLTYIILFTTVDNTVLFWPSVMKKSSLRGQRIL